MQHRKVLLVEDDALTQFMMGEMLEDLGYDYDIAEDGAACISVIKAAPESYFLILMDINMPRLSGVEATSRIRNAVSNPPKGIPILAVTADSHWQNISRCEESGFSGVLPKPVKMDHLESHIEIFKNAA